MHWGINPDSETSDILLIKGVCKNWPRQKGFRWKGNIPVLLLGSQIGHQALLLVGGHPYGAGEVFARAMRHWALGNRGEGCFEIHRVWGLFALKKPRIFKNDWRTKVVFLKNQQLYKQAIWLFFSLGKNSSIHWASILVLLEFSYAIIFLFHLQMLHSSRRDSRGLKKIGYPMVPKKKLKQGIRKFLPLDNGFDKP